MFAVRRHAASPSAQLLRRRLSAQPKPKAPPPTPPTPSSSSDGAWAWAERAAKLSLLGLTGAATACAVSDTSVFLDRTRSNARPLARLPVIRFHKFCGV